MNASRAFKAGCLLLLVLTVSLKLALGDPPPSDIPSAAADAVAVFLGERNFEAGPHPDLRVPRTIRAVSSDCRLLAAVVAPQGWHRDVVRHLAAEGDEVFFLFRGALYRDQPTLLTRFDHYAGRAARSLRLPARAHPVVAIVAASACRAGDMPWPTIAFR